MTHTIVAVLTGPHPDGPRIYDRRYVDWLRTGIERHTDARFRLITDAPEPGVDLPLAPECANLGKASIVGALDPRLDLPDSYFLMGLDTVIAGTLRPILDAWEATPGDLVGICNINRVEWASGLTLVRRTPRTRTVWDNRRNVGRSFDAFIRSMATSTALRKDLRPVLGMGPMDGICSYKAATGQFPLHPDNPTVALDEALLILFHGAPRLHEVMASNEHRGADVVQRRVRGY